ncbi:MAG: zinc ribbon domain-containing protein [Myxococcales bacterium]
MPPVARTELEPEGPLPCPNCGQAMPAGAAVCQGCGAARGEANRCPHCHAIADVEPHRTLGFRCLVCGGPRIALGVPNVTLSPRTTGALTSAGSEQTKQIMFSAAGFMLAGMGALALLIAAVVVLSATPGPLSTLALFLAASVPLAAGLLALVGARAARARRDETLRAAELSALGDLQAVTGALSAARVAELMRVTPERAEMLLASASVENLLAGPPPRLRVEAPGATVLGDQAELAEAAAERGTLPARGDTET